ncbi:hypothetical protein FVQ98_01365 [Ottowia sp. GY511]|uniref:Lipoprotein n=1 Tax=Ottowia flava TaxID=2675430 RepID=A0ABW4KS38_9BURK|nr:hypothetical protein [Ottowia sp. GY511]TXK33552.1 hypothetical protein FVQ98_01365 [Ottowia sp. GY511]
MAVQPSSSFARRAALGVAAGALALLGGCVVAPVDGYGYGYDTGSTVVYPGTTYYETPNYYYGGAPYYYGPSFSLGVYGHSYNGHRWHGNNWNRPGGWHGNNGHRPGWQGNHGNRPGGWQGNNGNRPGWQGNNGNRPPPSVQPRPPRPPMPNNGLHPRPGRSFGESGMGIDRRGGTPGNP